MGMWLHKSMNLWWNASLNVQTLLPHLLSNFSVGPNRWVRLVRHSPGISPCFWSFWAPGNGGWISRGADALESGQRADGEPFRKKNTGEWRGVVVVVVVVSCLLLFVVCCLLLLFVVCCLLFVVCRLWFVVCRLLFVVCCLSFVVCRLLFVVCC